MIDEVAELRRRLKKQNAYHNLVGRSPRMNEVFERVARVASSSCNVLVTGETGTGKELVAQAIHTSDVTRHGPLVAVNCAALPEPLLESELFGHERGAFTGADRQKKGRFELARGGTLFLDEIGDMPLGMQAKLLRVLQDGRFERVGGTDAIHADCRVVAATNLNLVQAVSAGRFRQDLFYRLNVFRIELPPLRDRLEDIPLLVNYFIDKLAERNLPPKTFSRLALSRFLSYDWPGNVRELEHVIEQAIVTTPGPIVAPENLPPQIVARHDEPFTLDFDHHRPLPEITAEFTTRIERPTFSACWRNSAGASSFAPATAGSPAGASVKSCAAIRIDKRDFKPQVARRRELAITGEWV